MDYQDIIYTKEDGIATITLNRPDKMNAFSPAMHDSMQRAVEDAINDDAIRVLVFTATGRAFCSGADVKAMAEEASQTGGEKKINASDSVHVQLAVRLQQCGKPVIAAINGVAVGGGLDLACACDIRIASDRARFAELFVRRGIVPAMGGTFFFPRLVGIDKACQLIWTGDMIDAREAERIGLVTMVVPHEDLESATRELAEKIATNPPLAIRKAKQAIYEGLWMDLASTLKYAGSINGELQETEDYKEGTRAFMEKREPVFRGR